MTTAQTPPLAEPGADVPWARFDDVVSGSGQVFAPPHRVLVAHRAQEVAGLLEEVDRAARAGAWAVGYVAYEAAAGLGTGPGPRARREGDPPLAWFGLCTSPAPAPPLSAPPGTARAYGAQPWRPDWTDDGYRGDVERVRAHIAQGDVYQCNLTVRLRSCVSGDLTELYADLVLNQRTRYGAYLDVGSHVVLSASPELFFEWRGERITTRPMKGTAPRGRTPEEDRQRLRDLTASEKERAENIIVVDLLRNDVGRVAAVGSVDVPVLCAPERFETVWQLTSDVTGTLRPDAGLLDVFRALFPSGSVTGAPKHRAMQIIEEVESSARGVYCGAIGVVAPPAEPVRARFSVGIRTLTVDRATGEAVYGTGGGITWASEPEAELAEVRTKARILQSPYTDVELVETMRAEPEGVRNLDRHLQRMDGSARYLGFRYDVEQARRRVARAAAESVSPARLRLLLRRDGALRVEVGPLPAAPARAVTLVVDPEPVDVTLPWLYHKTTNRQAYVDRAARHPEADDVVLVNDSGRVTETTVANLAARLSGVWFTPPVLDGCLPGVERTRLVEAGVLIERSLRPSDLQRAQALAVVNSLRGWRTAQLLDPPTS